MVHFYRNVFTAVPNNKVKEVAGMLKAIHAQEDRDAALEKATAVVERLESMKLSKAAGIVRDGIAETLSYYYFPREHWVKIRTKPGAGSNPPANGRGNKTTWLPG